MLKAGNFIELPKDIVNSQSCINIKNTDNKCLEYCICLHLFYAELAHSKKKNNPTTNNKYRETSL